MSKIPSDEILESLHKLRIRESAQLKIVLELYDLEIHQKISIPNYQKLKSMMKGSIDQKLRLRYFDVRHEKIESGQWSRVERECQTLKEEKVSVIGEMKKGSVRKEIVVVSVTRPKIARKNQNTMPPHLLSPPYHENELCRGREVSQAKVTMGPFFDNRVDII